AVLMHLSRNRLVRKLKDRHLWDDLAAEGVECVVYYDQDVEISVWLFLLEEQRSDPARITFDAVGRLVVRRLRQAFPEPGGCGTHCFCFDVGPLAFNPATTLVLGWAQICTWGPGGPPKVNRGHLCTLGGRCWWAATTRGQCGCCRLLLPL